MRGGPIGTADARRWLSKALDPTTFGAPTNGFVPVYDSASGTWIARAASTTPGLASTLSAQQSAAGVGNVGGGLDTLFQYTLPGGTLSVDGDAVLILASLQLRNGAAAGTQTVRLDFGGTVYLNYSNTGATINSLMLQALVSRTGGASQIGFCQLVQEGNLCQVTVAGAAEVLSGDVVIALKGEDSGAVNNNVRAHQFFVQLLKEAP